MGTGTASYMCGCSSTVTMGGGPIVAVRVCERHRQHARVRQALDAQQAVLAELGQAMREAHNDVSPLEVEQEERAASGERYR